MGFSVDYDKAVSFDILPEGEYEAIIEEAYEDVAKSGTKFISLQLVVRNDVDQDGGGRKIFAAIWQVKATGEYQTGGLNAVAKACQIPNGKQYKTIGQLVVDFVGKPVRVELRHEEYNGKTNARVKSWGATKFSNVSHVTDAIQVSNEAIPF